MFYHFITFLYTAQKGLYQTLCKWYVRTMYDLSWNRREFCVEFLKGNDK